MIIGYEAKRIFHNNTGLGNYGRDLIRILSDYAPQHNYLLYNPKLDRSQRFTPNGVNVMERKPLGIWKSLSSIWRQGPILRQAQGDGIDIFHGLSGELPRGIHQANFKSVVTIHDLIFVTHPAFYKSIDRKIYFNKFKYAAQHADVVIAISEYTKRQIVEYLRIPAEKIKVIYQTCHPLFKKEYEKKYGDYILMVGTLEERKNALALVKAVAKSKYKVKLVGRKTRYTDSIIDFIHTEGMQDQIEILDDLDIKSLVDLYKDARMLCYTSLVEGFGIPIIEALYTQTPVLHHHEGVFAEAAGNGLAIDMNDPLAIRSAIDELWENEIRLKEMSSMGYEYAQRFNDEVIAQEVLSVYQQLMS